MKPQHSIVAMFHSSDALMAALHRLRRAGYEQLEAYSPRPLEEAGEFLATKRSPVPLVMLLAGAVGFAGAFLLQVWAAYDFPIIVAGRPLFSWPAFVPVTFELTVLTASFCGLAALLIVTRLPRLDHPVFEHRQFERATQDAFFLRVIADDVKPDIAPTVDILRELGAEDIEEISS